MIVGLGFVLYVIIHVFNAQVHQPTNAHLVRTLFTQKDKFLAQSAFVLINISMILKIRFANLVHQHVMLVRVIKTHALNV